MDRHSSTSEIDWEEKERTHQLGEEKGKQSKPTQPHSPSLASTATATAVPEAMNASAIPRKALLKVRLRLALRAVVWELLSFEPPSGLLFGSVGFFRSLVRPCIRPCWPSAPFLGGLLPTLHWKSRQSPVKPTHHPSFDKPRERRTSVFRPPFRFPRSLPGSSLDSSSLGAINIFSTQIDGVNSLCSFARSLGEVVSGLLVGGLRRSALI